jgi:hypothetical protein
MKSFTSLIVLLFIARLNISSLEKDNFPPL